MAEHTKGPWIYEEGDDLIEAASGGGICHIINHGNINTVARTGEHFSHADARLIAAAPTLLAACIEALAVLDRLTERLTLNSERTRAVQGQLREVISMAARETAS